MSDYKADLLASLKNTWYAAKYLTASAKDSVDALLVALRDVAEARLGLTKLAADAKVNRENLYRMLSEEGNPRLRNLTAVVDALGLRIIFVPKDEAASVPGSSAFASSDLAPVNVIVQDQAVSTLGSVITARSGAWLGTGLSERFEYAQVPFYLVASAQHTSTQGGLV